MNPDKHNPNATDLADSVGGPIDRLDERGHENPGMWPASFDRTAPTENHYPAGGMISTDRYADGRRRPQAGPESSSPDFPLGDGRGIKTEN
jgi:hypothetical protein